MSLPVKMKFRGAWHGTSPEYRIQRRIWQIDTDNGATMRSEVGEPQPAGNGHGNEACPRVHRRRARMARSTGYARNCSAPGRLVAAVSGERAMVVSKMTSAICAAILTVVSATPEAVGQVFRSLPTTVIEGSPDLELSGIVRASQPGQYWTHEDSGHPGEIFRIDENGKVIQTVLVEGATAVDWEAILRDDDGNLLIGDLGNNRARRELVTIIKIAEPEPSAEVVQPLAVYTFRYPEGRKNNCEAFFLFGGKLYLIKKVRSMDMRGTVFCLDKLDETKIMTARRVGILNNTGHVTDVAYSSKRNELAVLTYGGVWFYKFEKETDMLTVKPRYVRAMFAQAEGICYVDDAVVVLSERGLFWKVPVKRLLETK